MFDGYNATVIVRPPKDFPGVDTSFPAIHAELIGAPSWTQCENLVQKVKRAAQVVRHDHWSIQVIAVSSSCATSPCFGGAADLKDLRFVGLNGFHVVWSFFHLTSIAPLTDLEHAGQTYCRRSWDSIQQDYKDVVQFEKFCFRCGLPSRSPLTSPAFHTDLSTSCICSSPLPDIESPIPSTSPRTPFLGRQVLPISLSSPLGCSNAIAIVVVTPGIWIHPLRWQVSDWC